jgi:uncharacterized membrane protein
VKQFVLVSLFFVVFAGVIGGALFLVGFTIKSLHLSEDAENVAMAIGAVAALVVGGLLMKQLHGIFQRRM